MQYARTRVLKVTLECTQFCIQYHNYYSNKCQLFVTQNLRFWSIWYISMSNIYQCGFGSIQYISVSNIHQYGFGSIRHISVSSSYKNALTWIWVGMNVALLASSWQSPLASLRYSEPPYRPGELRSMKSMKLYAVVLDSWIMLEGN